MGMDVLEKGMGLILEWEILVGWGYNYWGRVGLH